MNNRKEKVHLTLENGEVFSKGLPSVIVRKRTINGVRNVSAYLINVGDEIEIGDSYHRVINKEIR